MVLVAKRRNVSRRMWIFTVTVFYMFALQTFLVWVIGKNLVKEFPQMPVSAPLEMFNDTTVGPFQLAYSADFETNPQVSMANFVKNSAFGEMQLHQLTTYSQKGSAKEQASSFSKEMISQVDPMDISRFEGGIFLSSQSKDDLVGVILSN
mmetsp:Transcript_27665/g.41950  ORF Transcript_27665/g.41950 Transcript_27665/m.41950 type:complete len:150 (-) Transcript_27665:1036-1485(-)